MSRTRPLLLIASLAVASTAAASTTEEIESFDDGVFTNPFFQHELEFDDPCCVEIVFRIETKSFMLHLRPNTDTISLGIPPGMAVEEVRVTMIDLEGGIQGDQPTSIVRVGAASGDFVALHVSAINVVETVSANTKTPGAISGEPLGEIVDLQFQAANQGNSVVPGVGAFFGDITVVLCEAGVPGDVDGDGMVGISDLLLLLAAWGPCPDPPAECPEDVDGDGAVGIADLLLLLANWG